MKSILFCLLTISAYANARSWTNNQVNEIFDALYTNGASDAEYLVTEQGSTAYDFGLDLMERGERERSISWYDAMIAASDDPGIYLIGKAWVQKESGDLANAIVTANKVAMNSDNMLVKARASYLLGTFYLQVGSPYANSELLTAKSIYQELGLSGGVNLCQRLLGSNKSISSVPIEPPRDDTGS